MKIIIKISFLFLASVVSLLFAGCSESEPPSRTKLNAEFQGEFGFAPSTNMIDLRCKTFRVREVWLKWFMFSYDYETFQRITNQSFNVASPGDMQSPGKAHWSQDIVVGDNPNAPGWWPKPPQTAQFYYNENYNTNYHMSYIYLWVDVIKNRIYVKSAEWD